MTRKCFFSFHYEPDCTRASQVRKIGSIEGNPAAHDNDWEAIAGGGDAAIKRWIDKQMDGRTCAVVLVGQNTANRKWITHEIIRAWDLGLGVVGIRIHGLKNLQGLTSSAGANPLDYVTHGPTQKPLSSITKCYDPIGNSSKDRYDWIATHLGNAVEEAISIRQRF